MRSSALAAVLEGADQFRVRGAERGCLDLERALVGLECLLTLSEGRQLESEVVERGRHPWVLGAVERLEQLERLSLPVEGGLVLAALMGEGGGVVEQPRRELGVVAGRAKRRACESGDAFGVAVVGLVVAHGVDQCDPGPGRREVVVVGGGHPRRIVEGLGGLVGFAQLLLEHAAQVQRLGEHGLVLPRGLERSFHDLQRRLELPGRVQGRGLVEACADLFHPRAQLGVRRGL